MVMWSLFVPVLAGTLVDGDGSFAHVDDTLRSFSAASQSTLGDVTVFPSLAGVCGQTEGSGHHTAGVTAVVHGILGQTLKESVLERVGVWFLSGPHLTCSSRFRNRQIAPVFFSFVSLQTSSCSTQPDVTVLPAFIGVGRIAPGTRGTIRVTAVIVGVCQGVVWEILGIGLMLMRFLLVPGLAEKAVRCLGLMAGVLLPGVCILTSWIGTNRYVTILPGCLLVPCVAPRPLGEVRRVTAEVLGIYNVLTHVGEVKVTDTSLNLHIVTGPGDTRQTALRHVNSSCIFSSFYTHLTPCIRTRYH